MPKGLIFNDFMGSGSSGVNELWGKTDHGVITCLKFLQTRRFAVLNKNAFGASKFLMTLGAVYSLSAWALTPADPSSMLSAKSVGRGSSTSASSAQAVDGLLLNAASLAFENQYAISFGLTGMGNALSASIVDTKSGPLGGGLYYIRRDLTTQNPVSLLLGDYRRAEDRAGLSLFSKFSDKFALGITGKYLYQKSEELNAFSGRQFNGDFSLAIVPSDSLKLAFSAQNLIENQNSVDPKAYVFGAEFKPASTLMISGQLMNISGDNLQAAYALPASDTLSWSAGVAYQLSSVELRGGYLRSSAWNRQIISAGLGYGEKSFSLDYAFQYEQESQNQFHGISVTGYL